MQFSVFSKLKGAGKLGGILACAYISNHRAKVIVPALHAAKLGFFVNFANKW